jgi:hypothetical protein
MGQLTYAPTKEDLAYTFGARMPVAHLRSGDVLITDTEDCFGGAVRAVDDLPSKVCRMPYLNPATGPFFIEDAEPGDTLAVHFLAITPARDVGVSSTFPHFGALTGTHTTATLQPPLEERVWLYEIDTAAGFVRYRARTGEFTVDLPLDPMHGTVGVAPAGFEARTTITCDAHGGNIDTPELRAGTTLYLGVNVHGLSCARGWARPPGPRRGLRRRRRGRDAHHHHRRGHQGRGNAMATHRDRPRPDVGGLCPAAGGRVPDQPTRPRLMDGRADRTGHPRRLPARRAGRHRAGGQRVRPELHDASRIDKAYLPGAVAYESVHQRLRQITPASAGNGQR